ncbi:hypothetical protein FQR65_LT05954 [Abscondita terminalis]|nr:hypothetical protein FQR65_LT05954 [Abscondita terminalis]
MHWRKLVTLAEFRQFLATICLGPITYGAHLSWTSPVLPQLQNQNSTVPVTLTVEEGSWVGSMLAIGVLCTATSSGYLADRFGLRRCIAGLVVPNVIFALIVCFSRDVYSLCVARFFSGIAAGGVGVFAPMYISDMSDAAIRGIVGSFFEFLIYVGVMLISIFGAYVHYITLTIILGIFSVVVGIGFLFLPESPTYLIKTGKKDQAILALKYYRRDSYDVSRDIDIIYNNVQDQQQRGKINIKKTLSSKPVVRGLIASIGLTISQQACAINAVVFYSVNIFEKAQTGIDAYTSSIILSVAEFIAAFMMIFIMEKAPRRVYLYLSAFGCGIGLTAVGIYFTLTTNGIYFVGMEYIPLISLNIFAFSFALALGPIPWLMNGELFSSKVKGVAIGITVSLNWIFLFLVTKTFPIAMINIGPDFPFYFYALCMALCLIFIKFCVPETRGKTIDEIQIELNSKKTMF